MVVKVEEILRMTDSEAIRKYPNNYLIMRMDNMEDDTGTILYIGDTEKELLDLFGQELNDTSLCGILEGENKQCTMGGVVVYA